jgi:hypothetical protein
MARIWPSSGSAGSVTHGLLFLQQRTPVGFVRGALDALLD